MRNEVLLTLPAPPPPVIAPERPAQTALRDAMERFLAANPVRREPDYGDVQEAYRILVRAGYSVGRMAPCRGGHYYLINDWRVTKRQFQAKARKVADEMGWS